MKDTFVITDDGDIPGIELQLLQDTISEGSGLYATQGTISRIGSTDTSALSIILQASVGNSIIIPGGVVLDIGESEKTFYIGALDNGQVDGFRNLNISAQIFLESCNCNAEAPSPGVQVKNLVIADNDGPSLSLLIDPLSMKEGRVNAGTLTVTRNTPTSTNLQVSLSVSDTTEMNLPPNINIPMGSSSLQVPIETLADTLNDGNQQVTIHANAPAHSPGSLWAIVTDINKPDLVISSTEITVAEVQTNTTFPFRVFISNKGFSGASTGVDLLGYLSFDDQIDDDDHLIGQYEIDVPIAMGDTVEYLDLGITPPDPGTYQLIFEINDSETLTELLYLNNIYLNDTIEVLADYEGTALVEDSIFFMNKNIEITGSSIIRDSSKLPNSELVIRISNDDFQRKINISTDSAGDYRTTFVPFQKEAGHYTVGTSYPGSTNFEDQDSFDILGVKLDNGQGDHVVWDLVLNDTVDTTLSIQNLSHVDLSDITIVPSDLPDGCSLSFDTLGVLPANSTVPLGYRLSGSELTGADDYQQFPLRVTSQRGNIQNETAYYFCQALSGHVAASISSINTNINKDRSRFLEFSIYNEGQGETGDIHVDVPDVGWIQLATPEQMMSISPGDTGMVILELIPSFELPLNTPAKGSIVINATNGNSLTIPYRLEKVSETKGGIIIDVVDQFTYFTEEAPHVENARVRISHYFTGELYADGFTDLNGQFAADSLPAGTLRVVVDAEKHLSYDGVLYIAPGLQRTEVLFLEYQAISFSWDVVPTTVEDEYDISLIMDFETNVPVPVVVIEMPDSMPALAGNETFAFNVTLTNHGLITAEQVELILPEDSEYEFITNYEPQDLLAQQAIQVPVVFKRRNTESNSEEINLFVEVSELLHISQPEVAANMQQSHCVDIIVAFYKYKCGDNGLFQRTGKMFDYPSRSCYSTGSITFEYPEGEIPSKCTDCSPPKSQGGDPPQISIDCKCNDCEKRLFIAAASCIPGPAGIIARAIDCVIDPNNKIKCSIGIAKSSKIKCIKGIITRAIKCGYVPGFPAETLNARSESSSTYPLELQESLDDLNALRVIIESKEKILAEYFGNLISNENLYELGALTENFLIDENEISSADSLEILLHLSPFDFGKDEIPDFIHRWNTTLQAWNMGIFSPQISFPDIIDRVLLNSYQQQIDDVQIYVQSRGHGDLAVLVQDALYSLATVNLDPHSEPANGSINLDPVCASVSLQINQRLTMTREAFEGTLTVFNGHPDSPLQNFALNLIILNEDGEVSNHLFEIETTELNLLTGTNGNGTLPSETEGYAKILFIPETGAAPQLPTTYNFGGSISYLDPYSDLMVTMPLVPVSLTVNPSPDLFLHYFMPRDIYGDDPLTEPVEPILPAQLAIMIENNGYGVAQNVVIESAQPEIIDNDKGLSVNFRLIGSNLQGQPQSLGLNTIPFGNINPLAAKIGQWYFTSPLLGHFVSYETNLVHLNSRGNPDLSLISGIELHELTHSINVYGDLNDSIDDFLVNEIPDAQDIPDAIYLSQGNTVNSVYQAASGIHTGSITAPGNTTTLEVDPLGIGWNYLKTDDPGDGNFTIVSMTRDHDGQIIPLSNVWLTHVTIPDGGAPIYENKFHFVDDFDAINPITYTIVWSPVDPNPPEVVEITGHPDQASAAQVTNLQVSFSEQILDSTFTIADLNLSFQGGPNIIDDSVIITKLTPSTYDIDVSSLTTGNGFYVFTVQGTGVKDLSGVSGVAGKQASWTQFLSVPVIEEYIGLPEDLTASEFDTVQLLFNLPIDTSTLKVDSFQILLGGIAQSGTLSLIQLDTTQRLFELTGLGSFMSADGEYILEIDLRNFRTTENIYGLAIQNIALTLDSQGPSVTNMVRIDAGGLDRYHFTGITVNFDESIPVFDSNALELRRDGVLLDFAPVEINQVTESWYEILWNKPSTYPEGSYQFGLDMSKIVDYAGNQGTGTEIQSWIVDRIPDLEITNLAINPDLGISSTDNITSTRILDVLYHINEPAQNVHIYQNDNGNLTLLEYLPTASPGDHVAPIMLPTGGNTAIHISMEDSIGNEVIAQMNLYVDETALSGTWDFASGVIVPSQPDTLFFDFRDPIIDVASVVDSVIQFSKDNNKVPVSSLSLAKETNQRYFLSGISGVRNQPGKYSISMDLSNFNKISSGLSGNDKIKTSWIVQDLNRAPVADAGTDTTITKPSVVILNGSQSSDPDGDSLSYLWTSPPGITLNNQSSPSPSFEIMPNDNGNIYTFLLEVYDGKLRATDQKRVKVDLELCLSSNSVEISDSEWETYYIQDSTTPLMEVRSNTPLGSTKALTYNHIGPFRIDSHGRTFVNQDYKLDILDPSTEYNQNLEIKIFLSKSTLNNYLQYVNGISSIDDLLVGYSPEVDCENEVVFLITDTLTITHKEIVDSNWYSIDFISPGQGTFYLFGSRCPKIKYISLADKSLYVADQEIISDATIIHGADIIYIAPIISLKEQFAVEPMAQIGILNGNCDELPIDYMVGGDGFEILSSMSLTSDGGYIAVGRSTSSADGNISKTSEGSNDYWLVKFDGQGTLLWDKLIGGNEEDLPQDVIQNSNGEYIISGYSGSSQSGQVSDSSHGNNDIWIVKVSETGNIISNTLLGGSGDDFGQSISTTSDGGLVFAGYSSSSASGNISEPNKGATDYWIVKLDSLENIQWNKMYGGDQTDIAMDIESTIDEGFILAGYSFSSSNGDVTDPSHGGSDFWLVKINAGGNMSWNKLLGGNGNDFAWDVQQTNDHGYIVVGYSNSSASGDVTDTLHGLNDYWITKLDSLGNIQWEKLLGGLGDDRAFSVLQTSDGGFVVGGRSNSSGTGDVTDASQGGNDFWVVKLDSMGNTDWDHLFGGSGSDIAVEVQELREGGFLIGGYSSSSNSGNVIETNHGNNDFWIIKLDANGNIIN